MVYFRISDVRFFKNEWIDEILVRAAYNEKDYKGGRNNFCRLEDIGKYFNTLTE